jgi:hypothetical protein
MCGKLPSSRVGSVVFRTEADVIQQKRRNHITAGLLTNVEFLSSFPLQDVLHTVTILYRSSKQADEVAAASNIIVTLHSESNTTRMHNKQSYQKAKTLISIHPYTHQTSHPKQPPLMRLHP